MQQQIQSALTSSPDSLPRQIAQQLNCSELEVLKQLPKDMVAFLEREQLEPLLKELPNFGKMTTIIQAGELIFEVKDVFPKGRIGHGYYNIGDPNSHLHGHLKLENIAHIALVSKPFRQSESHCFQFLDAQGHNLFKIYLGRDKRRQLLSEQLERFQAWKSNAQSFAEQ
ncbi:heme utilization cystosolic carrier protein HutX [Alginatibacterium sediminis]|uniref:Heme utilization cystosolic carrier protein HutX n=1 Tax=Alginatibacterium sediminis TaxID=2164068 RepID=A0A420EL50_9ALTE|nr:heme utilization cystosolic carrier protein HutX [Alginatibacterium sediminis]RKF21461.1 heme utilization cystosolic carrier protein HutX [Alginatibacterium sediminis]